MVFGMSDLRNMSIIQDSFRMSQSRDESFPVIPGNLFFSSDFWGFPECGVPPFEKKT
jgi:hypothetical protein